MKLSNVIILCLGLGSVCLIGQDQHIFISKGNHPQELNVGGYIAVATTLTEVDAKRMLREYRKLKCPKPDYAYVTNRGLWYLYFNGGEDIDEMKLKRDVYRKNRMFKGAWLLTVYE